MQFNIILNPFQGEKINFDLKDKYTLICNLSMSRSASKSIIQKNLEIIRREGAKAYAFLVNLNEGYKNKDKFDAISVVYKKEYDIDLKESFLEGLYLSNYRFSKYKTESQNNTFTINSSLRNFRESVIRGNYLARDLVNEPLSHLNAEKFSKIIKKLGKEVGFQVEVLNEKNIEALKMGGVLSVNKGSIAKPTFNILTYRSKNIKETPPIVLVGKGVMYDTGGLSLKPTLNSMDMMKCDMGGAAAVVGTIYALARSKSDSYVVGLIPAVENRPGGEAYVPGDVIKMMNGIMVEVLNTDAEGRLILADALHYAKCYKPDLVIDLATLTGSAARAIGKYGIVAMENYKNKIFRNFSANMENLVKTGDIVGERVVVQPFWDDYKDELKSSIADIKNLGGLESGHITAGKFLEYFVAYPWIHLDIAGLAFLQEDYLYHKKGGTGIGVRLLTDFIVKYFDNE